MSEIERKYNVLMQELADLLKSKNDEITYLRYLISDLEAKLKDAEETVHAE